MYLLGFWNRTPPQYLGEPTVRRGSLSLYMGAGVNDVRASDSRLVYTGAIFGRSDTELCRDRRLLDAAFGTFSYLHVEQHSGEVTVGADRMGYGPLYYAIADRGVAFSTSLTRLRYVLPSVSPNFDAWEEMLCLGSALGAGTTVREICRLESGRRIHLNSDGATVMQYSHPQTPDIADCARFVEENNRLVAETLELTRDRPEQKVILLSGGLDSRRIAVTAADINLPFATATQEAIHSGAVENDVTLAREVAGLLEVEHRIVPLPGAAQWYNDALVRDYWCGFETAQHEWILPLLPAIPKGALLFDGVLGDVIINGYLFREYPHWNDYWKDTTTLARAMCEVGDHFPMNQELVSAPLVDRVCYHLRGVPKTRHRLNWFKAINRQRRGASLQSTLFGLYGHRPCLPFTRHELIVQSLSWPTDKYLDDFVQRVCIRALNEPAADIPYNGEELASRYVRSLATEQREREALADRLMAVRADTFDYFPGFRSRYTAYKAGRFLHTRRLHGRYKWSVDVVRRFSRFLDWLDDTSPPPLDCPPEQPNFIQERMISE